MSAGELASGKKAVGPIERPAHFCVRCHSRRNKASIWAALRENDCQSTTAKMSIRFQEITASERKWAPNTTLLNENAAAIMPTTIRNAVL